VTPHKFTLALAVLLSMTNFGFAAATKKQHVHRWHGYGFLPGYHQPPNPGQVHYGAPSYRYGGGRYYFGEPGFSHDRWNGGSYGPCWTHTPIGLMWNCG
jgi:hypothetical protein